MMKFHPDEVTECQSTCALRFLGYEYEEAADISEADTTGAGLSKLIAPVVSSLTLHEKCEDNHASFFGLQRFLCKWGGEYSTVYSNEQIAFDFLFLHLA